MLLLQGHACFRRAVFFLALLISLVGLPAVSLADEADARDLDAGIAAVERGDYAEAFGIFEPLAQAGDAEAQHNLAILYRSGRGVEKDLEQSLQWFLRAAEQGVAAAQYNLGYMYDLGEGVEQSDGYAFLWYSKAAEQGHPQAQANLGVMYANGSGVKQDLKLAYVWFNLAAAQGYVAAFKNKQIVAETFSEDELKELRNLSREYFQKYVWPFQAAGMMRGPARR